MNAHQRRLEIRARLRAMPNIDKFYPHQIAAMRAMMRQKKIVIAWPSRVPNIEDISHYMSSEMLAHQAIGRLHRQPIQQPDIKVIDYPAILHNDISVSSAVIKHADEAYLHIALPEAEKNQGAVTMQVVKERMQTGQAGKYSINLEGPLILKDLNPEGEAS